jgi:dihydrofolate reductase
MYPERKGGSRMRYIGILACDEGGVIGNRGKIPWDCPEDKAHYHKLTQGKTLIMGRRTYESMPESALTHHRNIVFSRTLSHPRPGCPATFVSSWEEFTQLDLAHAYVIGGGEILELFLENNALNAFYLTKIAGAHLGDAFFDLELLASWHHKILETGPGYSIVLFLPRSDTISSHENQFPADPPRSSQ